MWEIKIMLSKEKWVAL